MHQFKKSVEELQAVRNRYGKEYSDQKQRLLNQLDFKLLKNTKDLQSLHSTLLFLLAYPDNKIIFKKVSQCLKELQIFMQSNKKISASLYNAGLSHTNLCASFSFELVKWMRKYFPDDIRLSDMEANDGQINSILSVVMPKVESEILQDGNADWKSWLLQASGKEEELLDRIIAVFDQASIRPEVKDELWGALGINVEIYCSKHTCLPVSITKKYFHRSLINKKKLRVQQVLKPQLIKLDKEEAEQVVAASRMVLVRQLREIDPITFTSAELVSYYGMGRGLSIALMGMVRERRHPIDSYIGYVAFKNGLPVAYAGSWILFDSARIGLNVFPEYRGGESAWIFQQVLNLHQQVYKLNRFTVDPYQLGKDNADGIQSGAFWIYYKAGFRPMEQLQKRIAEDEMEKIKSNSGYRSPAAVLKKLAAGRLELVLNRKTVRFDATDCSRAYAEIVKDQFNNNRKQAEAFCLKKLEVWLKLANQGDEQLSFVLKNWCVLLFNKESQLPKTAATKKMLKRLFEMKVSGDEKVFIKAMQGFKLLREQLENGLKK